MEETVEDFVMRHFDNKEKDFIVVDDYINEQAKKIYGFDIQFQHFHIGGFESNGYDVDCYAYAFIDENEKLHLNGYERESYQ